MCASHVGGPVYVAPLSDFGKVEPDCAVVNGHKAAVQEVAFSPFHPGLMATGSNDSTVG
jgi:coronin-7